MDESLWFSFLYYLRGMEDKESIYEFIMENKDSMPQVMDTYDYKLELNRIKAGEILRKYADTFTNDEWKDGRILKWCVFYNYNRDELYADFVIQKHYTGVNYYRTKEKLDIALSEAGKENIKAYMGIKTTRRYV